MKHKYIKEEPLPMHAIDAYFAIHMVTLLIGVLLYYMNYFYLTKFSAITYISFMFDDLLIYAVSPIIPLLHALAFGVAFVGLRKDIGIVRFMAIVLLFIDIFAVPVGTVISIIIIIYLALPSTARFFTPIGKKTTTYRAIGVGLLAVSLVGFVFTSGISSTVLPSSEQPMPMLSAIDKVSGIDISTGENIDVIVELWGTSSTMQAVEMQSAVLQSIQTAGGTIEGRTTRVVNAINTKVNSDYLLAIASNPNVKKIIKNEPVVKLMYVDQTAEMEARNPNNISWIGEIRKIWGDPQTTGKGIVIAIVDSGIDDSIEALQRNGKSVVIDKFLIYGEYVHWHGTAVASCIASQGTDMYPELMGVAPGVDLLNVEVFLPSGVANPFDILKGWEWVAEWKVEHPDKFVICSNSLGVPASEPGILDVGADNMVLRYGIPMVVASGNEAPKYHVCSPGMGRYVLTVGAVDQFGALAPFSCTGVGMPSGLKKPDVCALGVDVPAFQPHDTFPPVKSVSGTSFSTPIVAGMMALLYEAHPGYDASQLCDAIRNGAKDAGVKGFDNEYGYGIADLYGASTAISSEKPSRYYIYMFAMLPIIAIVIMFYPEIDKKLNLY